MNAKFFVGATAERPRMGSSNQPKKLVTGMHEFAM
jgi:hypothetical protein